MLHSYWDSTYILFDLFLYHFHSHYLHVVALGLLLFFGALELSLYIRSFFILCTFH